MKVVFVLEPTLTLGRPRVKDPSCADAANYYDDLPMVKKSVVFDQFTMVRIRFNHG